MKTNVDKYLINGISLENIRNSYETKVIKKMKELLPKSPKFDFCSICIQDVYALALSRITPKYVQEGTVVLKNEYDEQDFSNLVGNAIKQVMERPNHPT